MLRLEFPEERHEAEVMALRAETFAAGEDHVHGSRGLDLAESYAAWLAVQRASLSADTTPEGKVPAHEFLAVRGTDGRVVGMINIRDTPDVSLVREAGHIGYCVRPGERGKGYAVPMLRLALAFCRDELGMSRVLITCNKANLASAATIRRGGGVLADELAGEDGLVLQRYWIGLA